MSCLTVTLNAAIDATYRVNGFQPGSMHRVTSSHRQAGGKGNNVARILTTLGQQVIATGFLAGVTGSLIEADLRAAGIVPDFVWLATGESRTCHAIVDESSGEATELLEAGPTVTPADAERLIHHVGGLARLADVVVISGSAPPGMSHDQLVSLGQAVRSNTRRLIVDASGETLVALLHARPDTIKPNRAELEPLLSLHHMGQDSRDSTTLARIRERLAPDGRLLVSLGAEGAVLFDKHAVWRGWPPPLEIVNPVGCGDAMVAGFVCGLLDGEDSQALLCSAVATGSAAALQPFAGQVSLPTIDQLRPQVRTDDLGTCQSPWSPFT